jgi:hypothetical protein
MDACVVAEKSDDVGVRFAHPNLCGLAMVRHHTTFFPNRRQILLATDWGFLSFFYESFRGQLPGAASSIDFFRIGIQYAKPQSMIRTFQLGIMPPETVYLVRRIVAKDQFNNKLNN